MATAAFINEAYLAYFGRPVDYSAVTAWAGSTNAEVEAAFFASPESQALYGTTIDAGFINSIYNNLFGRDAELPGVQYWLSEIAKGHVTPAGAAVAILNGAQGSDITIVDNKLAATAGFTAAIDTTPEAVGYSGMSAAATARAFISTVTDTPATQAEIDAALLAASSGGGATGTSFRLTTAWDDLTGTTTNDTFNANVVQNVNGEQTNQLATGDTLDGSFGHDSLFATVQMASALNTSASQAITPETVRVEDAWFTALTIDNGIHYPYDQGSGGTSLGEETVTINAKHMLGLDLVASLESDASLLISNLTTLTDSGVYADRRVTESVTVRMDHTGNGWAVDAPSDMTVLFDNDYLIASAPTTESQTYWWLLDQESDLVDGPPLAHIDSDGLVFTIDGATPAVDLIIPKAIFDGLDGSYAAFVSALNDAIALRPELAGYSVSLDPTNYKIVGLEDLSPSSQIPAIVLTAPTGVDVTSTGFHHYADATGAYNVFGDIADTPPVVSVELVTSDIELFKVGRGGDGGDLIVGGMAVDTHGYAFDDLGHGMSAIKQGVEQFNITVFGDETQFSSLASLSSTNNTLQVVNVVTDDAQTGTFADLMIGNDNTDSYALQDVQIFDASVFKGNLYLEADLTWQVTPKYLDLQDQAPDAPALDNVAFQYTGGLGNDSIYLDLSTSNLDDAGAATREDFTLNIAGGSGDDTLTLDLNDDDVFFFIGGTTGEPVFDNWYDNQVLLANLRIDGGAGDDTIWTPGSGNVIIDAGTGLDTVYADNIGDQAVWAFNVENVPTGADSVRRQLNNLQSDANDSYNLFNATLTVDFKGFEVTVDLSNTNGVTSDLQINQAIKLAINSDPVLSQLLSATDGPANTLVVTSLIDGEEVADNLSISLDAPTALTASEVSRLNGFYGTSGVSEATLLSNMAAQIALFDIAADYSEGFALNGGSNEFDGSDSTATSDNLITPGLDNDVIVLGTGDHSNDGVKYIGYDNGTDSIVHFDTEWFAASTPVFTNIPAATEVVTLSFSASDGTPAAQTIILDGDTVNLSAPATQGVIPAIDVAFQFAQQFVTANWTVTGHVTGTNTVEITRVASGDFADLTAVDITGTYVDAAATGGGGTVGISTTTQGADAATWGTKSTFAVNFDVPGTAAAAAGDFVFDGTTVAYAQGDGAISLANKLDAASFANWDTVRTDADTVTFTAKAPGATAIGVVADFDLATNTIVGTISGGAVGAANVGTPTITIVPAGPGYGDDYLDFTTYNATAVLVDGVAIVGSLPATGVYIELVESLTNVGEYTISEHDLGALPAATDDVVTLVGVADFGATQVFHDVNFHI